MLDSDRERCRARARELRERADSGAYSPLMRQAFYEIARVLENRAMGADPAAAIVERPRRKRAKRPSAGGASADNVYRLD
jgi:hypothetical protein